ncbi:G-protein coupled receptor 157-like isoform X3 [Dysidea avara]|uniref:G-protein coupled receptor 157-like isoform X3 n=1 Tax=Dysidea avara TaxID=196820 RepID=UPI003325B87E
MDSNLKWSFAYDRYTGQHSTNWTNTHHSVDHVVRIVSGVTCILSILGSLAIIFSYIIIKSIRSKAREILVHLSVMDLTFTSANLIGLVLPYDRYLLHEHSGYAHDTYDRVCKAQAFTAVYGTIGSVLWTLGLAVYLYYRIVSRDGNVTKWVVRVLYVVCYALPLYVSLWLLLMGHLGYPKRGDASGGWCSVLVGDDTPEEVEKYDETLMLFMVDDIWMILTFVTMIPIYLIVHCYVREQLQEYNKEFLLTSREKQVTLLRADQKFLLVPAVFMVLRVWDIIASVLFQYADVNGNMSWLTFLDAIGDSAQGFCNFLLFCVFQRKVRDYFRYLICRCMGHVNLTQSDNYMKEEDDDDDDDNLLYSIPNE